MQNLFIKICCVSWKQLFFSCCLVCICMTLECWDQYTLENKVFFRRLAVIHRAAGIPTSGACGNIPCRRYTAFWWRREVCAKSVYRLLASKGLNYASLPLNYIDGAEYINLYRLVDFQESGYRHWRGTAFLV